MFTRIAARVVVGFALLLLVRAAGGQQAPIEWRDANELAVEGRGWAEVRSPFDRLPAKAEKLVRKSVWDLSRHSAGYCIRFVSDSPLIAARWKLRASRLEMPHMAATGVSGLDLYVLDGGRWKYVSTGRPTKFPDNEATLIRDLGSAKREYRLYLPLYNGVERVEVGVAAGASLQAAALPGQKPVVFYGTSITQGGCASRPGMAYPAILGRMLNVPVINLGFSGNGKSEPEMAELVAEIDASAYVLDSLPNLDSTQVAERVPGFVDTLRRKRPSVPILLVESIPYTDQEFVAQRRQRIEESNANLGQAFGERQAKDKLLFLIPGKDLLGSDGEGTVDSVHPTDLGFLRMAEVMAKHLRQVPGLVAK